MKLTVNDLWEGRGEQEWGLSQVEEPALLCPAPARLAGGPQFLHRENGRVDLRAFEASSNANTFSFQIQP